jgi:UDP-N-acetylglucosamine/UDP-N-acetylgalactosamine diphosphorylase
MVEVPDVLRDRLRRFGQEHVLRWWPELADAERDALIAQLQWLDLGQLLQLYAHRDETFQLPPVEAIAPVPVAQLHPGDRATHQLGEEALRRGAVAALVVAGGQGSRLGFEHPKGMFPISPVRNKTLFELHAEKLLALARRYGRPLPLLVMTSPATHDETVANFRAHDHFGLLPAEVTFFCQGTMPALDMATGKLLLEERGRLFASPNGHGGVLLALADMGLLAKLRDRGVETIFYFQVDNPVLKMADPLFVGHHLRTNSEVSTKVVAKEGPTDKLGNLVLINGRCGIIEYSDLPDTLAHQRDEQGRLRFRVGNPAIHLFSVEFLERVSQGEDRIPFHVARKKVPYLDDAGNLVQPAKENALKFEMFIFDVLPRAERWSVVETTRRTDFEPLKNATGPDSPATVRQAMSNLAADWLEQARVQVPRTPTGDAAVPLEISALFALDAEELATKVTPGSAIAEATYFG